MRDFRPPTWTGISDRRAAQASPWGLQEAGRGAAAAVLAANGAPPTQRLIIMLMYNIVDIAVNIDSHSLPESVRGTCADPLLGLLAVPLRPRTVLLEAGRTHGKILGGLQCGILHPRPRRRGCLCYARSPDNMRLSGTADPRETLFIKDSGTADTRETLFIKDSGTADTREILSMEKGDHGRLRQAPTEQGLQMPRRITIACSDKMGLPCGWEQLVRGCPQRVPQIKHDSQTRTRP
ncbi:hypothetical protein PMIN01_04186 [Paraphaeosphaeria minitans]|uniref:Uncharacterized protein n=1 Tax=Paraphaeosphaeria minitans TaxID=565426 RepID=A0A9P6GP12_9PLEO|nr:hypothetical protein PMIN01_04186 [Paraphaeosphaeria minitans]